MPFPPERGLKVLYNNNKLEGQNTSNQNVPMHESENVNLHVLMTSVTTWRLRSACLPMNPFSIIVCAPQLISSGFNEILIPWRSGRVNGKWDSMLQMAKHYILTVTKKRNPITATILSISIISNHQTLVFCWLKISIGEKTSRSQLQRLLTEWPPSSSRQKQVSARDAYSHLSCSTCSQRRPSRKNSISIGGRPICNLRFTDNMNVMDSSNGELQDLTNWLVYRAIWNGSQHRK